jgi:hypothetical protein
MSRGGYNLDDFRDFHRESDSRRDPAGSGRAISPGRGGSSQAGSKASLLERLRAAESKSDRLTIPERDEIIRRAGTRDSRRPDSLSERLRTKYLDRERVYRLRTSEIATLTEVAKFRVVPLEDLAQFGYAGDRSRLESDVRQLTEQALAERRGTSAFKKESQQVLTITKQGRHLIRQHGFVPEEQAIYSGLVKPKELAHDAALYRLYQKAAAEIESKDGKVLRIQLDYELKEKLYRRLGQTQTRHEEGLDRLKQGLAREMHLPVSQGKLSFPDLRIEYETPERDIAHVDFELATSHYHASHLAEKARVGFQIYARSQDAAGLRRVRDEREILTSILSF